MNTITHIETELNPAGIPWVYCTFALRGKRFVAYIPGNKGDGNGNFDVLVATEDQNQLNRPSDYGMTPSDALGDDNLPDTLWVKNPCLEDSFTVTTPNQRLQTEVEHRLLGAVASAFLHPNASKIVTATVDHERLREANRARSEEAEALHIAIKGFLKQQDIEYGTTSLASLGSRRAVKYTMPKNSQ